MSMNVRISRVVTTLTARITLVVSVVDVRTVSRAKAIIVLILMNVKLGAIIALLMLTVKIQWAHSSVHAMSDFMVMASRVMIQTNVIQTIYVPLDLCA